MTTLRKGARIETSGQGRTATWPHGTGTVTKVRKNLVYVHWDGTHFEDEMQAHEVRPLSTGNPPPPEQAAELDRLADLSQERYEDWKRLRTPEAFTAYATVKTAFKAYWKEHFA